MTLNQGFRSYLLRHIRSIVGDATTPQFKIEPLGFLNMLQSSKKPSVLRLNTDAGHQNSVQVKYKQRWTKDFVSTGIDCDTTNVSAYRETAVNLSSTRAFAIHIDDETIAKYEDDASRTVMVGQPATGMMNEFLEDIYSAANAILSAVNTDLLTTLSANIGINRRTGANTASTLNINKNSTVDDLSLGLTLLLADYKLNGGSGTPQVVGGGLFSNFAWQQAAKSAAQNGLDTAVQFANLKFYYDNDVPTVFAANNIVVFQPDSVQIVEYLMNTGFKAGAKGTSIFGTLMLPMFMGAEVIPVEFDFQLKYVDCATTMTQEYYGDTITVQRGWNLILSKQCGLFTIPSDAYRAGDPLAGNRGTLLYNVTNTCDDCA
jgi:hypothetical protein